MLPEFGEFYVDCRTSRSTEANFSLPSVTPDVISPSAAASAPAKAATLPPPGRSGVVSATLKMKFSRVGSASRLFQPVNNYVPFFDGHDTVVDSEEVR